MEGSEKNVDDEDESSRVLSPSSLSPSLSLSVTGLRRNEAKREKKERKERLILGTIRDGANFGKPRRGKSLRKNQVK